ncbi:3541_t:CDS:2 [Dentiscutata heterogama]|uniref:3541_t:CDS:1 n=1 Tax=Dentiscutata heterogama TaxID=1316150 RepID=A0ACA9K3K1_9GLOM|nr:3541_t:CDS:2 [Dentiscutata heterogama]
MSSKSENSDFIDMVYNYDWSSTQFGPMDTWDPALRNAANLCLRTEFPMCIYFDPPNWALLYNNALGKLAKDIWPEIFETYMNTRFNRVITTGKGFFGCDLRCKVQRDEYDEDAYFTYTYSPIFKSDGTICALWCLAQETTQKVLNTRRLKLLEDFGHLTSNIESLESACDIITKKLKNNEDIPYTFIYFVKHNLNTSSESSLIAHLISTTFDDDDKEKRHIPDYLPETHEIIDLSKDVNKSYGTYIELKRINIQSIIRKLRMLVLIK